jgi:hypothetical protein
MRQKEHHGGEELVKKSHWPHVGQEAEKERGGQGPNIPVKGITQMSYIFQLSLKFPSLLTASLAGIKPSTHELLGGI